MKQKRSLYLAGIVLLALALRLPRILTVQVVLTEGTTYATIARNLAAGRGYVGILGVRDFFVPPLYPLLMAGLMRLGLDALWAGRLLSLILGAFLPLPVYWLTRELSGRRAAGFSAALFIAGHPLLIIYAGRVWSETTYSFLVWCGLCCAWAALTRGEWTAAALTGLCFGAAYLTRHEGAVYFAVFLTLMVVAWTWKEVQGSKGAREQGRKGAGAQGRRGAGEQGRRGARAQGRKGARAQGSRGAREQGSKGAREQESRRARAATLLVRMAAALAAFALLAAPYVVWLSGQAGRLIWETKSVPNFVTAQRLAAGMSYTEAAYGLTSAGEPAGPFLFRNQLISQPPADAGLSLVERLSGILQGLRDEAKHFLTEIASPLAVVLALFGLLAGHWDVARLRRGGFAVLFFAALLFLLPWMVKPLAAMALLAVSWSGWDRQSLARAGFLLAFLLPVVAVISLVPRVYSRYLTPLTGYVALWGGMGLSAGYRWARETWKARPRWAEAALSVLLVVTLAVVLHSIQGGVLAFRPPRGVLDLDQRSAGEWLAAHDPAPDKRIMSVHSQLPFYAGGVHVPMPYAAPVLAQHYAKTQGANYVVVSPRKLRSRLPLEPWTRGEAIPSEWQSVYRDPDAGLTIYQAQTGVP